MLDRIDYRHDLHEDAATRALWAAGTALVLIVLALLITAGTTRVASNDHPALTQPSLTLPIVPVL